MRCSARARSIPTAARDTRCTSTRSRSPRSRRPSGTTTSWFARSRPTRRSGHRPTANARCSPSSMGSLTAQALYPQLLIGLINGAAYALLSLGLSIIFGLLNVINFAHGALYMLGAFVTWGLLHYAGIPYWGALIVAPLAVGAVGVVLERTLLHRLYRLDPLYNLLLTFGITLLLQGLFQMQFG